MTDYGDRGWATNDKREKSHGGWVAFVIVLLLLIVGSSDIIEKLLS